VTTEPFKTAAYKMDLPNSAARQFAIYKLTEKWFRAEAGFWDGQT
jgi:hypothetical protein